MVGSVGGSVVVIGAVVTGSVRCVVAAEVLVVSAVPAAAGAVVLGAEVVLVAAAVGFLPSSSSLFVVGSVYPTGFGLSRGSSFLPPCVVQARLDVLNQPILVLEQFAVAGIPESVQYRIYRQLSLRGKSFSSRSS